LTPVVEELIEVPVGQQPPIERPFSADTFHMAADSCRAVLRQSIVPLGMIGELINCVEIVNQQSTRL
jgi:hypothetical protein